MGFEASSYSVRDRDGTDPQLNANRRTRTCGPEPPRFGPHARDGNGSDHALRQATHGIAEKQAIGGRQLAQASA